MTRYSVVIPSKNEDKVYDAVDSVLAQERKDFEVIVVDGSEGRIKESLKQYCLDKPKTRFFHESEIDSVIQNRAAARNFGAKKSKGDIIVFMDADCEMKESFFPNLEKYLEHHEVVECNVEYQPDGDKRCVADRIIENNGRDFDFLTAGLAVKRRVFQQVKFDENLGNLREDTDFGLRALEHNFSYTYGEQARIKHKAGKFTPISFLKERARFQDEPLFRKKLKEINKPRGNYSESRIAFPKELLLIAVFLLLFSVPGSASLLTFPIYLLPGVFYIYRMRKQGANICPDTLWVILLAFPAMMVKRLSIWRGSAKHSYLVI